eukprot:3570105-Rhodomonas_salina.3
MVAPVQRASLRYLQFRAFPLKERSTLLAVHRIQSSVAESRGFRKQHHGMTDRALLFSEFPGAPTDTDWGKLIRGELNRHSVDYPTVIRVTEPAADPVADPAVIFRLWEMELLR